MGKKEVNCRDASPTKNSEVGGKGEKEWQEKLATTKKRDSEGKRRNGSTGHAQTFL